MSLGGIRITTNVISEKIDIHVVKRVLVTKGPHRNSPRIKVEKTHKNTKVTRECLSVSTSNFFCDLTVREKF